MHQAKPCSNVLFRMAFRLGGIVISKDTEVEVVQAASVDSSNSHERFIEVCNKEISKLDRRPNAIDKHRTSRHGRRCLENSRRCP